jgi:tRNA (guanine26-N2/guanine27-N2)-dimethyltransferase
LNLDFPTEVVREGKTNVVVPKLKAYVKEAWEYAPSKAPVFYNPAMELNRDLAVLTFHTYQQKMGKEISVCEPLAGCGIRSVRFAMEVEGVRKVVVNDINPQAAELAKLNVERNQLTEHVSVTNEDANLLLSQYAAPRKRFDFVDVDPFGSPVPYMDSAVRALRDNGLLALTATDMAPLCGVHPKACVRKYGGKPLRTSYCHELAVRLLAGCLTMTAAKHEIGVEIIFSHSTNHYVRAYAVVSRGAKQADNSVRKMGHILHCFKCLHREVSKGMFSPWKQNCVECGSKLNAAGPLWLGKIFDEGFCELMEKEVVGMNLGREKRIRKLLSLARIEAEAPITYYAADKVCDKLNLRIPPLIKTMDELRAAGFQATPTHFNSRGIRTNASAKTVKEIITKLVT